ncbi:hypothetical protein [Cytobacillus firmus]|uniref:hypothetical protein n=1 Tax=Cytobacillus firmus TaxID=1399 RepID=UPI002228265F|nr:hypothetical protein [Cytobacillus firmus]
MGKGLQENVNLDNTISVKVIVDEYVDWYAYAYDSIKHANTELAAAVKTGDYESAKDSYEVLYINGTWAPRWKGELIIFIWSLSKF